MEKPSGKTALIVVDMQYDFIDGSLAVPGAERVVDEARDIINAHDYDYVIFTQDSHPRGHISFASRWDKEGQPVQPFDTLNGNVVWPDHCVIGTRGHAIHDDLHPYLSDASLVVPKGTNVDRDAYTGFDSGTLETWLRELGVDRVKIIGLAFDYCVRATALDAAALGFRTEVIKRATASVFPADDDRVQQELAAHGVEVV